MIETFVVHIIPNLVVLNAEFQECPGAENVRQSGHRRVGANVLRRTRKSIVSMQYIGRICRPLLLIVGRFDFPCFVVARRVPNVVRRKVAHFRIAAIIRSLMRIGQCESGFVCYLVIELGNDVPFGAVIQDGRPSGYASEVLAAQ